MDSRWFVRAADEIASRLEFASATPGRHWSLSERLHGLDCLLVDLQAAAAARGLNGAEMYGHARQLKEELSLAIKAHDDGDLGPWRSCRDRVFEFLAVLRASCPEPAVAPADAPVSRAAQATTPKPPVVLNVEERTMLKTLWENGAESEADGSRLKKEDVEAFGKMKPYASRKAADSLYQKGLIDRFNDRRGGYWLTPRGIEVARSIWPPKNRGPQ
jgi:hypothetical protein